MIDSIFLAVLIFAGVFVLFCGAIVCFAWLVNWFVEKIFGW